MLPHHGSSLEEVRTGLKQGRLEAAVDSVSALSRDSQALMLLCLVIICFHHVLESHPSLFWVYSCFCPSLRPANLCDLKIGPPDCA